MPTNRRGMVLRRGRDVWGKHRRNPLGDRGGRAGQPNRKGERRREPSEPGQSCRAGGHSRGSRGMTPAVRQKSCPSCPDRRASRSGPPPLRRRLSPGAEAWYPTVMLPVHFLLMVLVWVALSSMGARRLERVPCHPAGPLALMAPVDRFSARPFLRPVRWGMPDRRRH